MYQVSEEFDLTVCKLVAKGHHSVAAVRNLIVDLGFGLKLEIPRAKTRNDLALNGLSVSLGSVTDRALLPEKRCFVSFTVGDDKAFLFCSRTGDSKK